MSTVEQSRHPFTDLVTGEPVTLVITGPNATWYDEGRSGVEHDGCDRLAGVSADLDAFYCPGCSRNGRLSGAWAMDMLRAHRARVGNLGERITP